MVLDYIPCDVDALLNIYEDYKLLKNDNSKGKFYMRKFKIYDRNDKYLCNKHKYQE